MLTVDKANRVLKPGDLRRTFGCQSGLDLELFVAREIMRLCAGELWAEPHGSASMLVLPLEFSGFSHTILARDDAPCLAHA
jgi:hypothetical protein